MKFAPVQISAVCLWLINLIVGSFLTAINIANYGFVWSVKRNFIFKFCLEKVETTQISHFTPQNYPNGENDTPLSGSDWLTLNTERHEKNYPPRCINVCWVWREMPGIRWTSFAVLRHRTLSLQIGTNPVSSEIHFEGRTDVPRLAHGDFSPDDGRWPSRNGWKQRRKSWKNRPRGLRD